MLLAIFASRHGFAGSGTTSHSVSYIRSSAVAHRYKAKGLKVENVRERLEIESVPRIPVNR